MKKLLNSGKLLLAAGLTAVMLTSTAAASEIHVSENNISVNQITEDGYVSISKNEYVDELGYLIVDETFVKNEPMVYSDKGSYPDLKRSYSVYENDNNYGKLLFVMWVYGDFSWDGTTAKVTNCGREINQYEKPPTVTEKSFEYGSDRGSNILFGNKYAYVEYKVKATNDYGFSKEYRLWLDVNRKGDISVDN